jgi:hypothetical protein
MGPVASQEAIKMLGTNGGGFFNANSAHPYENPTPLTNFLQMLAIFLIPARCASFRPHGGRHAPGLGGAGRDDAGVRRRRWRHHAAEQQGNPLLARAGRRPGRQRHSPGGNMEGKETRFGIAAIRPVRHHHHGRLLRRGERHARLVHAARRHGAAGADAARRSGLRRRRLRACTACWSSPSWRCSSPA